MSKVINMNHRPQSKINLVYIGLLLLLIIAILASCSTTSKTKSVTRSTTDSVSTTKVDSSVLKATETTAVKKDNSVTTTETEDNYTKETVIEFDTAKAVEFDTLDIPRIGGSAAADYFPPNFNRVKKITIRETGIKKEKVNQVINKQDSTKTTSAEKTDLVKSISTDLHKTETVKNKEKETTSYWGWLWLALIVAAAVYIEWRFKVIKWFAGLFKKEDEYKS